MKNLATTVKLSIFFLVAAIAAAVLGLALNETQTGGPKATYHAIFTDASFLKPNQEVRIGGVRIGTVGDLELTDQNEVRVTFDVSDAPELPESVEAAIRYKNLVGDRYLELLPGDGGHGAGPFPEGGTIPVERTRPAVDLDVLVGGFKPLFRTLDPAQVNSLTGSLIAAFQGESGSIATLMASTASLTSTLADRDQVIGQVITNLRDGFGVISSRDRTVTDLIDQLQGLVSALSEGRDPVSQAVVQINGLTSSAADLLSQVRPDLKDTLPKLQQTSTTINDNTASLEGTLQELPETYRAISRIGVSGDFFNFFLCNLRFQFDPLGQDVKTPWINSDIARCNGEPVK
ncbi:MCE family protein [Rhodococcus sp. T2V]|uniref:MCE family protein n=1 Tax=Rhodococcus sp. T2V TaxID=3034164 RepID=UPI0023E2719B|nr:MCE family protein [Rhodococcus sp. T2V]MDF3312154.1 MCE family protein [Rhodococcus sp. T2V]